MRAKSQPRERRRHLLSTGTTVHRPTLSIRSLRLSSRVRQTSFKSLIFQASPTERPHHLLFLSHQYRRSRSPCRKPTAQLLAISTFLSPATSATLRIPPCPVIQIVHHMREPRMRRGQAWHQPSTERAPLFLLPLRRACGRNQPWLVLSRLTQAVRLALQRRQFPRWIMKNTTAYAHQAPPIAPSALVQRF